MCNVSVLSAHFVTEGVSGMAVRPLKQVLASNIGRRLPRGHLVRQAEDHAPAQIEWWACAMVREKRFRPGHGQRR